MRLKVEMFVPGVIFQQFDGYCNVIHVFIILKQTEIILKINTNTLFRIRSGADPGISKRGGAVPAR